MPSVSHHASLHDGLPFSRKWHDAGGLQWREIHQVNVICCDEPLQEVSRRGQWSRDGRPYAGKIGGQTSLWSEHQVDWGSALLLTNATATCMLTSISSDAAVSLQIAATQAAQARSSALKLLRAFWESLTVLSFSSFSSSPLQVRLALAIQACMHRADCVRIPTQHTYCSSHNW